jgi:AcrR family transcriptional regulator
MTDESVINAVAWVARMVRKRSKVADAGERSAAFSAPVDPLALAADNAAVMRPGTQASDTTGAPADINAALTLRKRTSASPVARRSAILAAALEEFTARGYEGARLDDVAKRAGVAKGTIYLYFADKEALFQDLVRSMVHPVLGTLDKMAGIDVPARILVEGLLGTFVREVYGTRRRDLVRLILNEGPRFPAIAEFYYREVIGRVLSIVRPILQRAAERGELPNDNLARFPQLIVAPMLVGIMWQAMFERFEPLDVNAMVRAHIDILFAGRAS